MAEEEAIPLSNESASYYGDAYIVARYIPTPVKLNNPPSWTYCSCIDTAKWILGRQGERWGNASDLEPTTSVPQVGFLVLTTEGPGHTGVVASISEDLTMIHVVEGNWESCKKTERELFVGESFVRGFRPPPEKNEALQ